jgi:GT2 family glycosyltransferase
MRSGFDMATGEYFLKFDDDDGLDREFLEQTTAILNTEPKIDFVCTNHWIINPQGQRDEQATKINSVKWGKDRLAQGIIPNLLQETFDRQSLQVGSTLFRRQSLLEVDYMRPEADGCEDFDLLVRLALANKQGYFLPKLLMEYRFHNAQTSLKQDIHFLKAKTFCIDSYSFQEPQLERVRQQKLAWTQQILGIRLLEKGDSIQGRQLIQKSIQTLGSSKRSILGLLISYLPVKLRQKAFNLFRAKRSQDYSETVRSGRS